MKDATSQKVRKVISVVIAIGMILAIIMPMITVIMSL